MRSPTTDWRPKSPGRWATRFSDDSEREFIPSPNPWILDNGGEIFFHDLADGLARALGVNAANLKRSVEDYNRAVESNNTKKLSVSRTGKPKLLRPPLYGLRVVPGITFTMGGVAINGRAEVLNRDEKKSSACTPPATPSAVSWAATAAATPAASCKP